MADTTRRLALHKPTGGDPAAIPDDVGRLADQLDANVLGYGQGTLAARPAARVEGRLYYATDDYQLYYDTGTVWVPAGHQPGDVVWSARNETRRLGWLPCDGTSYERATYPALYTALGIIWGSVDRFHFNVPDLRGRVPLGFGQGVDLTNRQVTVRVGTERHRLTVSELPVHTHSVIATWGSVSTHGHSASPGRLAGAPTNETDDEGQAIGSTGGNAAHDNMQPSLVLHHWIKV